MLGVACTPCEKVCGIHSLYQYQYSLPCSSPTQPTIDPQVKTLRTHHMNLINLTRHCLPSLKEPLWSEGLIPQDVYDKAGNQAIGITDRCAALLDYILSRVGAVPSDFTKVLHILESQPFLQSLATKLKETYRECLL